MKKILVLFLATALAIGFTGCGGSDKASSGEASEATLEKGEFDLSKQGINLIIKAPSEPAVESTPLGYEVQSSDVFKLLIAEGPGDVALKKRDLESDEVYKVERFIVDEPNALFYELKFADKSEYHFFVVAKGTANTYEIQDAKGKEYSEEEVKAMFEAAKAARAK